ncbi:hypothetical protein ANCCEY_04575 [Ancylostoma ceylanicum]|uniref:Uncharacterized protein n=1 Tax=Ancylostoma ceylanicum TaxID=53326 RepID=A0A0D6LYR2_9BILA|nr:hypothetical protein ANCCEY_04575 [Ancylostoma ceylanicum]
MNCLMLMYWNKSKSLHRFAAEAAAAMTYGVGVAQNNADLGGGGGMNDEEYDENSSARLFERSRIKALAERKVCCGNCAGSTVM